LQTPPAARGRAPGAAAQHVEDSGARELNERRQTEQQAGGGRNHGGGEDHCAIDMQIDGAGEARRYEALEHRHAPWRNEQSECAARTGKQEVLGDGLAGQAQRTGAQRAPHGELAGASGGPDQQQVADVGARDQQDQHRREQQNRESRAALAQHLLFQRNELDTDAAIRGRKLGRKLPRNFGHIGLRGGDARVRTQPPDGVQKVAIPARAQLRRKPQRQP
jgi:hypothetical protein